MDVFRLLFAPAGYREIGLAKDQPRSILDLCNELDSPIPIQQWQPPILRVYRPKRPEAAIPIFLGSAPVFSTSAYEKIRPHLEQWGEFLQCDSDHGNYFVYHITNNIRGLDFVRCRLSHFPGTTAIDTIQKWAFDPQSVGDSPIFRLTAYHTGVFVTTRFDEMMGEANLSGYRLEFLASM